MSCLTHGRNENCIQNFGWKTLQEIAWNANTILKFIQMGSSGSEQVTVTSYCVQD